MESSYSEQLEADEEHFDAGDKPRKQGDHLDDASACEVLRRPAAEPESEETVAEQVEYKPCKHAVERAVELFDIF